MIKWDQLQNNIFRNIYYCHGFKSQVDSLTAAKLCTVICTARVAGKARCSVFAPDGDLSYMLRCLSGSVRSTQLLLDHLVELGDRSVYHQQA